MTPIRTLDGIKRLGTILTVWAHPDDETFVAGGLLAAAIRNGQRVICVTATRGEEGQSPDESRWPSARMGNIRTQELEAALQILGISKHTWLTYRDGDCAGADQSEATATIAQFIQKHRPDSIITFGPEGLTGHPDHQAVSRWTGAATKIAQSNAAVYHVVYDPEQYEQFLRPLDRQVNVFFNTDTPPLVLAKECAIAFELPPEILDQKWRALAAMPSQMSRTLDAVPPSMRAGTFGFEYFVVG